MHFVYIDDSGNEKTRCYSALTIHESSWKAAQLAIKDHRRKLKASDGMYVTKELHATEFVAGRGRVRVQIVAKGRRCQISRQTLELVAGLPNTTLMNAIASKANERLILRG